MRTLRLKRPLNLVTDLINIMGLINKVDMVCLSPVGYGKHHIPPYPTGDKHTISTLLIKPIFSVLAHAEKQFFSKLVFECLINISQTYSEFS